MATEQTPDSWDDDTQAVENKLGGLSLRADAPTFVPGKNVFAASFVPGGIQAPVSQPVAPQEAEQPDIRPPSPPGEPEPYHTGPAPTAGNPEDAPTIEVAEGEWKASKNVQVCPVPDAEQEGDEVHRYCNTPEATQVAKVKKKVAELSAAIKKEHLNIVFIGHVDAGKSTIGGRVLQATGMVDQRTLEKYEREAKEKNRETWYLSWALDTNSEERDKGKTVEVGRAYFETDKRHFTILDAPGHKSFVPNMIGGASQADIAVLVISARRGEFETGFERGGQTREHAMLVKTAGVRHLIVLINKMDDPTVEWDLKRYNDCKDKLLPYLKKLGFNTKTDSKFIPCSGLTGAWIKHPPKDHDELCPWYTGPSFLDYLESLPPLSRVSDGPVRVPIVDKYKDMGTIALGKVESGQIAIGQKLIIMPNKREAEIMSIWSDEVETEVANAGENVKIKLKNIEEEDISSGFVICSPDSLCKTARIFDAQVVILEHKSIICAGYSAILHFHTGAEEITFKALIAIIDRKTGEKIPKPRFIKQDQIAIVRINLLAGVICLETYKDFPQMGRFTLRDEGRTIAVGKVLKVVE